MSLENKFPYILLVCKSLKVLMVKNFIDSMYVLWIQIIIIIIILLL